MRVHFRLADAAEGEHGNVKAAEGKNHVFVLVAPGDSGHDFIAEEDGEQGKELVIRFQYRPATVSGRGQGQLRQENTEWVAPATTPCSVNKRGVGNTTLAAILSRPARPRHR